MAKMQNLIYDEAPYDILYYDANLDAYRTDRFAGWQNMPASGTPLFTYGDLNYTLLTDATARAEPVTVRGERDSGGVRGREQRDSGGSLAAATPAPAPSADTSSTSGGGGSSTLLLGGLVLVVVIVVVGGLVISRRRRTTAAGEDE